MKAIQITVFGASGKVGTRVVELALKRGYVVRAFVYGKNPFEETPNLTVVKGDIRDPRQVEVALKGSRAVVSCLGSWHTKRKDILVTGMRVIIPEMKQLKIRRIVTVTGADALAPGEEAEGLQRFTRPLFKLVAGKVLQDGELHMQLLSESGLAWTTVRSPLMNNFGRRRYVLGFRRPSPFATIRRQAVAKAVVDNIPRPQFAGKAPIISR